MKQNKNASYSEIKISFKISHLNFFNKNKNGKIIKNHVPKHQENRCQQIKIFLKFFLTFFPESVIVSGDSKMRIDWSDVFSLKIH